MLSHFFYFFSAAGLAGNLTLKKNHKLLNFVSSATKYVNVIFHPSKNHPQAMDSKYFTSRPPSTHNKHDEANVI
jgi:hypothetical protein